jgi:hypothetical protein
MPIFDFIKKSYPPDHMARLSERVYTGGRTYLPS